MKNLITPSDASKILNVSRKTLCDYINNHRHRDALKVYRITHKKVLYCRDSVEEFILRCLNK